MLRKVRVFENVRKVPGTPLVRELKSEGFFHGWFQVTDGPEDAGPVGLVEFPDGAVNSYDPRMIEFVESPADTGEKGKC